MKKFWVILLLLTYGLASSGATLQLHYCCGKLDKVSLAVSKTACGMAHKMGSKPCCADKSIAFKIKAAQQAGPWLHFGAVSVAETPLVFFHSSYAPAAAKGLLPEVFAPPPLTRNLIRFYGSYRI